MDSTTRKLEALNGQAFAHQLALQVLIQHAAPALRAELATLAYTLPALALPTPLPDEGIEAMQATLQTLLQPPAG